MTDATPTAVTTNIPRAVAMMLGASALVAGTSMMAKILGRDLLGPGLHPFQVSSGRFVFALLVIAIVASWQRPGLTGTPWKLHAGRSLAGWLGISCMFAASARMPLAEATAVSFLSPLITMLLAIPLLGERIGPLRWMAVGIAIAGALLIIRPGAETFQPVALIALAAACFMGFEAILVKRLSGRDNIMRIMLVNNSMGTAIAILPALSVWIDPTPQQWGMLALLGFTMACAQVLFIQAMKWAEASFIIPFFYATLIFAAVYDLSLFGDMPDGLSLVGAATIVAAAILLALREGRRKKPASLRI